MSWDVGAAVFPLCVSLTWATVNRRGKLDAQFPGIDRLAYNTHFVKSSLLVIPILVCVMQPYTPRFLFSRFSQPACRPTDQSLSHPIPRDAFVVVIFLVLTALLPHYKISFFKISLLCPNLPRGCRWLKLLYTSLAL